MRDSLKLKALAIILFVVASVVGRTAAQGTKSAAAGDLAVVVNPSVPVNQLSMAEVRTVFRGDRQYWSKDMPVVLLIRAPESRERDIVLKKIFNMTEAQFKQYWIAKIFRAEATSGPKIVYSNGMANELLAAVPGSIAFVSAHDVKPGLKVLKVDGHLPGEANYPLR